ncbi:MAG TPA: 5'/3'-nucleotidase SurE, partial [Acidimicrobiales bacterium]
ADATLHILVSNDDGYNADGIDALVQDLRKLPHVAITVVAPLTNQSGQGGNTTPGKLAVTKVKTKSGFPAIAVAGHPADAVRVALDDMKLKPDVVITGINLGQNLGPVINVSGTVGAARAAATRGVPALATSAGFPNTVYEPALPFIEKWIAQHRSALVAHTMAATVDNLNVPSCATGHVRGEVTVKPAPAGVVVNTDPAGCESKATGQTNDSAAFSAGFATLSRIPNQP